MALSIVTNVTAQKARTYLADSEKLMQRSIDRMATGYKINCAKDDAAGYTITKTMGTKLSSYDVASQNTQIGSDLLSTLELNFDLINGHLERIRELTMQAANDTYSVPAREAMEAEILARLEEISRVAVSTEYNGLYLMDGSIGADLGLQAGIYGAPSSRITMDAFLFDEATSSALLGITDLADYAQKCAGLDTATPTKAHDMLSELDAAIQNVSTRVTQIGALQNRLESAMTSIDVASQNLTASVSTMRDADIALESSNYIQAQILQQAAATLLQTANQTPSIALDLL